MNFLVVLRTVLLTVVLVDKILSINQRLEKTNKRNENERIKNDNN